MARPASRPVPIAACALLLLAFLLGACANSNPGTPAPLLEARFVPEPTAARLAPDTHSEYAYFAASVDVDRDTIVVGAWGDSAAGRNAGAAYVFERIGDAWELRSRLAAADAVAGDRFGHAVAVQGDVILVGAPYSPHAGRRSGAVYVFQRDHDDWTQSGVLHPADAGPDAYFGSAVALSDGTAVIGASGPGARSVYVFEAHGGTWVERHVLTPASAAEGARIGSTVAIHGDTLVVGAWVDPPDAGFDAPAESAAVVYERVDGAWIERAQLTSGDAGAAQTFGSSVAVDGDVIVVGAPGNRDSAYVFRRGPSGWVLEIELVSELESGEHFGSAVAVASDRIVVGAPGYDGHTGTAYVYRHDVVGWRGHARILAPDGHLGLQMANPVAMDRDTIVLGATGDSVGGPASGAAYVHR